MNTVPALVKPTLLLPRGPVLGWASFSGARSVALPSVEDSPHVTMTSSGRAALYQAASGIRPLFPDLPVQAVPYVFPVWFDAVDEVYAGLRAEGLPVFRWDRVWPGTPRLEGDQGLAWSHHVLQFLCHQDLNAADIRYIVQRACAGVSDTESV